MSTQQTSSYLQLYKYLTVLTEEQIIKMRKIATGILQASAFTNEEIKLLDIKLNQQLTVLN